MRFSIWEKFGFMESPYDHKNLSGDESGDALLVGRDREVKTLQMRIGSGGNHATVEGSTGVGKSSLVAVACYRMQKECLRNPDCSFFAPAVESFQLGENIGDFERKFFYVIAQTLIAHQMNIKNTGLTMPELDDINKWLNNSAYSSGGAGALGFQMERGEEPNTSEGYTNTGFANAVLIELQRVFPQSTSGAIICTIDNLELLNTSSKAREILESMRDKYFNIAGIRWVLCGSRGIVSRARSDRLSGYFSAPQKVAPLGNEWTDSLIQRRISYFGQESYFPPVAPEAFSFLYSSLNHNLRDALAYADQFSQWLAEYTDEKLEGDVKKLTNAQAYELLIDWLDSKAHDAFADAGGIQPRHWQFFDAVAQVGGTARSADFTAFDFRNQQQFGTVVTSLAAANLMQREVDPDDATRKLANITPTGWLAYHYRKDIIDRNK